MLRQFGPRIVFLRAGVYLSKALGLTRRRFPSRSWVSIRLEEICNSGTPCEAAPYAELKRRDASEFLFPLGKPPLVPEYIRNGPQQRQPPLAERLKLIEENRSVYCFRTVAPERIDWNSNPLDGSHIDGNRTWSEIPDVAPGQKDIRLFWDPARAAWAIDLARAGGHGISVDAGSSYWRWVDSWMDACPPWRGPNWKCGQEATVRLIALAIGFWAVADDPATTDDRWVQFARLAWATGYRIEQHFEYARSQKNNHALSEACGLMLVGHLFPEFRESARWFERGRAVFCDELARQVYADGSYVQHSMNYHRVMLQMAVLAARLAQWRGQPFDSATMQQIAAAEEFLFQMLDESTGRTPLYGNNDGAWVLPLDECDFTDHRGAVQAAHYLVSGKRRFAAGAWDEDLLWLFGPESLAAPQEAVARPQSSQFNDGGYYTLRDGESWGMIRCHTFRDRPAHYDQLHFDLWFRGQNLLGDSGTYQYNPPEGKSLEDYFQLARGHNTIELDGRSPVERVSRFLFFPWPRAKMRHFEADAGGYGYFEGESYDYDVRPWHVLHRCAIVGLADDVWVIIDDLLGSGEHTATLRWHLPEAPVRLNAEQATIAAETPAGECFLTLPNGDAHPWKRLEIVQGYRSEYYGQRRAIPLVEAEVSGELPLRLVTLVAAEAPAMWHREAAGSQGESYELRRGEAAWKIELAPRLRKSQRVVVNIRSGVPSGKRTDRGSAAAASAMQ